MKDTRNNENIMSNTLENQPACKYLEVEIGSKKYVCTAFSVFNPFFTENIGITEIFDINFAKQHCCDKKQVMNCLNNFKNSSACFITTACTTAKNLPDDCRELTTMRHMRDNWLIKQPFGEQVIKEYYEIAPKIVEAIDRLSYSQEIYNNLYYYYILPCVGYATQERYWDCYYCYKDMVELLKRRFLNY